MTYFKKRRQALYYALIGLIGSVRKESHMKIHCVSAVIVLCVSYYFSISRMEWIAIASCICLVIITEIINTAIEKICDLVTTEINPTIKYIKDISAAAVLIACLHAVVTGLIIFVPYWTH